MTEEKENLSPLEYFNKYVNISYVDPSLPEPDTKIIMKHYLCSALIYGIVVILFWFNQWFAQLMSNSIHGVSAKAFLSYAYVVYLIFAPAFYLWLKPKTIWISHNIVIFEYFKRILTQKNKLKALTIEDIKEQQNIYKMSYIEQQSIILLLIKVFFGVQMLSYAFGNYNLMCAQVPKLLNYGRDLIMYIQNAGTDIYALINQFRWQLYITLINIIFLIDLSIGAIGYFTESAFFKNRIRSVDNTPAGILSCICCYTPFVDATMIYLMNFHNNNERNVFGNPEHWLTWLLHSVAIIFMILFVCSTIAMFTKFSNLTNRGTVSKWPYSVVRHPAYSTKIIYWWLTVIPLFLVNFNAQDFRWYPYITQCILVVGSLTAWSVIYYIRALTEERHLLKDPEYQEYVKKVKYRFIPGLW